VRLEPLNDEIMKMKNTIILILLLVAGIAYVRITDNLEARSWKISTNGNKPSPVYETDIYPYGSQSPPNRIIGYLKPGEVADIVSMGYGKEWPFWKIRLKSGERGFIFAPDVTTEKKE
jgi:hypothetical protein